MFEVILIVSILFSGIYFILYHTYFNSHCLARDGFIWNNIQTTTVLMWQCRDSYVCSIENIEYDDLQRNVLAWECNKTQVKYFEPKFYQEKVKNLLQ